MPRESFLRFAAVETSHETRQRKCQSAMQEKQTELDHDTRTAQRHLFGYIAAMNFIQKEQGCAHACDWISFDFRYMDGDWIADSVSSFVIYIRIKTSIP